MTAKSNNGDDDNGKQVFNVSGGIHANNVIMGNQTNNFQNIVNIQNQTQFIDALQKVQTQITEIKQGKLTPTQVRNLEAVEGQIVEATAEAQKPQPLGEHIKATLTDAKETMVMLAGSLGAAAALGATIGELIVQAAKLFGG